MKVKSLILIGLVILFNLLILANCLPARSIHYYSHFTPRRLSATSQGVDSPIVWNCSQYVNGGLAYEVDFDCIITNSSDQPVRSPCLQIDYLYKTTKKLITSLDSPFCPGKIPAHSSVEKTFYYSGYAISGYCGEDLDGCIMVTRVAK